MAELIWRGKGKRRLATSASSKSHVEELHGEAAIGEWRNRLVFGDAARVLSTLSSELAGKVALAYVDPPFATGGDFDFLATIPGAPSDAPRVPIRAYRDARGIDSWLSSFHEIALSLRALLAEKGALYVHLDAHVAHYAKILLDEVFGPSAFQREIVWRIGWISGFKSRARNWIRNHDTILFYAKGGRGFTFHKEYLPYPEGYVRRDGVPPKGNGYPLEDVWNASAIDRLDSIQITSFSREKIGYPTQKNENLVARIVRASSNPGDIVLDCFVGSGTTAVVAEKLGRRWIACDASPIAFHAARKRILALPDFKPLAIEMLEKMPTSVTGRRKLSTKVGVDGMCCTVELSSFALATRALLAAGAHGNTGIAHWSQWIEDWCVDWDYHGSAMSVRSRRWRRRVTEELALAVSYSYERPGRYTVLVKARDVLGGVTAKKLRVAIR